MYFRKHLCKPFLLTHFFIFTLFALVFAPAISVNAAGQTFSANIYHVHTGSEEYGGGCYTKEHTGSESYEERCTGHLIYYPSYNETKCDGCGASYTGERSGDCPHSEIKYRDYTYYSLGCGLDNNSVIGSFYASKSTDDWTKSLVLNLSYSGGTGVGSSPYVVNGVPQSSSTYPVTENGTYVIDINTDGNSTAGNIVLPVSNIDHTPPQIEHYSLTPTEWTNGNIEFNADRITDTQPGGGTGCGLAEEYISYDNGETWSSDPTHTYEDNGTYTVIVKDKLDNSSSVTFTISNIDREAPIISATYDDTPNIFSTKVTVTATDAGEGAGLHQEAYSFDNGKTWSSDNTYVVNENTTIHIAVRDALGNLAQKDLCISNLDTYGPTITYECWPYKDTYKDVDIYVSVQDVNPDGTPGVGLAPLYLSYDNGKTWTDNTKYVMTSNGEITIYARDLHNNTSFLTVKVDWIDKSHSEEDSGSNNDNGNGQVLKPTPTPQPVTPVTPKPSGNKKKSVTQDSDKLKITPEPVVVIKKELKPKPTVPVLKSQPDNTIEVQLDDTDEDTNKLSLWQLLAIVLGILALAALLAFILFFLLGLVRVYCTSDSKKYKLVGLSRIRHKNDCYEINISESIIDSCDSTMLRFKLPSLFALLHEEDNVIIYLPDNQSYDMRIKEVIDITFKVIK